MDASPAGGAGTIALGSIHRTAVLRTEESGKGIRLTAFLLVLLIFLSGCGIRQVDTLPLPGGETAIYVKAQTRIGGMAVLDRWVFDPKTGKTVLVRSDSSEPVKGVIDALKGIPIPVPIP